MTQLTDKIWAAEVPDDARNFRFGKSERLKAKLFYNTTLDYFAGSQVIEFPPGTYRFLFTTKTATEEQSASVVQIISNGKISGRPQYRRYDRDNESPAMMWTRDSRHSLETLLRSKGLDDKNYALIEKL